MKPFPREAVNVRGALAFVACRHMEVVLESQKQVLFSTCQEYLAGPAHKADAHALAVLVTLMTLLLT